MSELNEEDFQRLTGIKRQTLARYQARLGNAGKPSSAWQRCKRSRASQADTTKLSLVVSASATPLRELLTQLDNQSTYLAKPSLVDRHYQAELGNE